MRPHPEMRLLMSLPRRSQRSHPMRGFTLIELMITVAIVGILASVAYPSYRSSVLKGKRAEGRAALLDLAQQQERYMTQNGSYLAFANGAANTPFKMYSGDNAAKAAYNLSASNCEGMTDARSCILMKASPVQPDPLDALTMTSTGIKSCTGTPTANLPCW